MVTVVSIVSFINGHRGILQEKTHIRKYLTSEIYLESGTESPEFDIYGNQSTHLSPMQTYLGDHPVT
jgi:hypothetical protein